jgi:hypothetical protein
MKNKKVKKKINRQNKEKKKELENGRGKKYP